ncbi:alpha-1D adrenergic receptor-like protein [Labeo rohita]|uniref:Alpha-1D adrenergic receptor n=3 Tax=Labeonini TaxID=2743697 RepID=A0ABQ8N1F6_LABRO|nr:alpha-1D adrenergic receptor [Labeo rohita]KAI2668276.1 Alpha-1D adrenergic receptor [Labeo rohita]RXN20059.1 alpha-1D adrenergic receptor-like protein [Labeo rohita]
MTFSKLLNESKDGFPSDFLSNISNTTCEGITLDSQVIGVGIFLAVFILVAIVGNILVILSVLCNKHLQTVTNFFIVNLAIADLLLSIIVLPFSASLEVLGCWVFGRVFCNIWAAVDVLCCTASILSLCIISIDRYIGVKYCLKYPTIMTERKAGVILVVVWVSSMVISIGPLLGWKEPPPSDESICRITEEPGYALFSSLFSFYLPLMVILVMYIRVYIVARRTTKSLEAGVKRERDKSMEVVLRIHCRSIPEDSSANSKTKNHPFRSSLSVRLMKFSREKKAAKTLAIVVGMFILCWLPFFFVLPLGSFFPALKPSEMVFKVIFWLGYFNSCINPIIYPCSSKEFQRAFTRLVRCQCQRRRRILRRFYDQRWRTAMRGARREPHRDYCSGFPFHEQCGNSIYSCQSKSRPLSLKSWSFFPPLQKSSFQLKEKMNNLSNKIKNGTGKSSTSALARTEIDTVSMGIYNDCGDQSGYQIYDLSECYGLKETDI